MKNNSQQVLLSIFDFFRLHENVISAQTNLSGLEKKLCELSF